MIIINQFHLHGSKEEFDMQPDWLISSLYLTSAGKKTTRSRIKKQRSIANRRPRPRRKHRRVGSSGPSGNNDDRMPKITISREGKGKDSDSDSDSESDSEEEEEEEEEEGGGGGGGGGEEEKKEEQDKPISI